MRRFLVVAMLAVASITVGAAAPAGADRTDWFIDESKLPFAARPGAEALWGVHAGAGYRIEVPANWNGDVVLYAHGYRGEGLELTVSNPPIRNHLIRSGLCVGGVQLPGQRVRARHRRPGHAPPAPALRRARRQARAGVHDGDVDGRPRDRGGHRAVAELVRRRPARVRRDGRQRAVRLFPRRPPRLGDHRRRRTGRPDAYGLVHEPRWVAVNAEPPRRHLPDRPDRRR